MNEVRDFIKRFEELYDKSFSDIQDDINCLDELLSYRDADEAIPNAYRERWEQRLEPLRNLDSAIYCSVMVELQSQHHTLVFLAERECVVSALVNLIEFKTDLFQKELDNLCKEAE